MRLHLNAKGVDAKERSRWIMTTTCHWTMMPRSARGSVVRAIGTQDVGTAFTDVSSNLPTNINEPAYEICRMDNM